MQGLLTGLFFIILLMLKISSSTIPDPELLLNEKLATDWFNEFNQLAQQVYYERSYAEWNYSTNITEENKQKKVAATLRLANFQKEAWVNASKFPWQTFKNETLIRLYKLIANHRKVSVEEDKLKELSSILADMETIYSTAKICITERLGIVKCNFSLEPDLARIMSKSRNHEELLQIWKRWRDEVGPFLREKYAKFVPLSNEGARLNNYSDTGEQWRSRYETETFEEDLEKLYNQISDLYKNLHAYIRHKLAKEYGENLVDPRGPIPAHLLGSMSAEQWGNLLNFTEPFPGKHTVDITPALHAQKYTAYKMFKVAEEFFVSLDLEPMPAEFWENSLITKPSDREVVCHASAWDFFNQKDFRIKQCTDITMEDLITIHHEMGHIQYFLQYKHLPVPFRKGANPGFHEAVGDVLALSVSTPQHLQKIGLLDEISNDLEGDINYLFSIALDKIAFLPFGYLMDQWRWNVFNGNYKEKEWNKKWWDLRCKYQGLIPPVKRTIQDFDPGAKYHISANVPYIRYFVSFIIQFQFHKALCAAASQSHIPLHKCDIYKSKEAGKLLRNMLQLGSAKPWPDAMEQITGQRYMDAGPMLEYFQPLYDWLKEKNKNETLGWSCSQINELVDNSMTLYSSSLILAVAPLIQRLLLFYLF